MSLHVETNDGVTVIWFDRPDVLNAFNDEMGDAAVDAVERASADEAVRCIVLTGRGRAFSAGEDLGALADGYKAGVVPELGDTLVRRYNPLIRAIVAAPKPVLAAVNGVAAGAGASVALACDERIAAANAKLTLAFVKVGLVPDSAALWFLAHMVGRAHAWRLAASGDAVDAPTAEALGIFDEVVLPDDFELRWRARAAELATGPTRAYALIKDLLRGASERSLHDQLEAEIDAQTAAGRTADHLEGVTAFFERRPPRFEGR